MEVGKGMDFQTEVGREPRDLRIQRDTRGEIEVLNQGRDEKRVRVKYAN